MKKRTLFLSLLICLFLLVGCGTKNSPVMPGSSESPPAAEEESCGPGVPCEMTCRIVDGADSGSLLLAEYGGSGIYTLNLSNADKRKLDTPLQNGQLLTIRYQDVLETWPGQFREVSDVLLCESDFDNRCALYLRVLEDLWEKDSGLNGGIEIIGVDLSQTSLSPSERSAVAWAFSANHGAELAEGTLEELTEQGYITATPISSTGSGTDLNEPKHYFYEWKNGCLFSITEPPAEIADTYTLSLFDAQKWRSSMGAYFFSNCWLTPSETDGWTDYHIGAEAIS